MINRLPSWFKQDIPVKETLEQLSLLDAQVVNTVCAQAHCPNLNSCFKNRELTFMILGGSCTRNCKFCAVKKVEGYLPVKLSLDLDEPRRILEVVKQLDLKFVVITSVTRDDLADGGSTVFAESVNLIKEFNPEIKVEVLIPDFKGDESSLRTVLSTHPEVVAHNLETVERLSRGLRPLADYRLSLTVLENIKKFDARRVSKSSLMLGLGETEEEVVKSMQDLRKVDCQVLTLGQYLAPSDKHYSIKEFIHPQQFARYRDIGLELGFKTVLSGPKVRSSYQAEEVYNLVTSN